MEVQVSVPILDFNIQSACSSPFITSPSSPKHSGNFYFSAPTSPTRLSAFYRDFNDFSIINDDTSSLVIPFKWEEKPGKPKSNDTQNLHKDDFAFDFNKQLDRDSLSAEELFDGGKIRPLKPPPRLQLIIGLDVSANRKSPVSSPMSQGKKMFREAFSPRYKNDFDPFSEAIEQSRKGSEHERGRERISSSLSSISNHRATRSLSPFRVSEFSWEKQKQSTKPESSLNSKPLSSSSSSSVSTSSSSSSKSYKKWRLKDFLLFRSRSEGRVNDKNPSRKYAEVSKRNEDVKNSSFESTDNVRTNTGSVPGSMKNELVSDHELHCTADRSDSEQMLKKTVLPYKKGILGCLGFNPTVHGLAKGFDSITRG